MCTKVSLVGSKNQPYARTCACTHAHARAHVRLPARPHARPHPRTHARTQDVAVAGVAQTSDIQDPGISLVEAAQLATRTLDSESFSGDRLSSLRQFCLGLCIGCTSALRWLYVALVSAISAPHRRVSSASALHFLSRRLMSAQPGLELALGSVSAPHRLCIGSTSGLHLRCVISAERTLHPVLRPTLRWRCICFVSASCHGSSALDRLYNVLYWRSWLHTGAHWLYIGSISALN